MPIKIEMNRYQLLRFLTVLVCIGYFGYIYPFSYTVFFIGLTMAVYIILSYKLGNSYIQIPFLWKIVWVYILISVCALNFPNSFRYFVVFSFGLLLIKFQYPEKFYYSTVNLFGIIGAIFSVMTLVQKFVPSIFYKLLKFIQLSSRYEGTWEAVQKYGQFAGIAGEVSFNAFIISVGMIALFARIFCEKKVKLRYLLCLIVMYYTIILSGKRSFLLMVPIIVCMIFLIKAIAGKNKNMTVILIIMLCIGPIVFNQFLTDIIMNILSNGKGASLSRGIDLSNREIFWNIAINMIKSKTVFGSGLFSYDNAYNAFFGKNLVFAGAHNSYLQLLAELGSVGGILYFLSIIYSYFISVKVVWKKLRYESGISKENYSLIFSFGVQTLCITYGMSGNPFHRPQQLIMYFLALALVFHEYKKLKTKT